MYKYSALSDGPIAAVKARCLSARTSRSIVFALVALVVFSASWTTLKHGPRYRTSAGSFDDDLFIFGENVTSLYQAAAPKTLREDWDWDDETVQGVNIGGWLVLEPFITPELYWPYLDDAKSEIVGDEWTLSAAMGKANLRRIVTKHYETFITEQDFAQIAAAGLNWVRIPIGYWAIETWPGEPFLERVSWSYFVKALGWARKYGLRVNVDLHTVPGSQNGWNHSGRLGNVNFLHGPMGLANAQRTLDYITILAAFLSQPENARVVPMFSVLNEPLISTIGIDALQSFYYKVYDDIRTRFGSEGPFLTVHDGFRGLIDWKSFLPGADRLALDMHPYLAFREPNLDSWDQQALKPCTKWGGRINRTMEQFGVALAGEWSVAVNDCGLFVNNIGLGSRFDGTFAHESFPKTGSCDDWNDYTKWTKERKQGLQKVAFAHMNALRNTFFWTWKTGKDPRTGLHANPMWSYALGLREGWMPRDPWQQRGYCARLFNAHNNASGITSNDDPRRLASRPIKAPLSDWATGGPGGQDRLDVASARSKYTWPPSNLTRTVFDPNRLPSYERNRPVPRLPGLDRRRLGKDFRMMGPKKGCRYPDAFSQRDDEVELEKWNC